MSSKVIYCVYRITNLVEKKHYYGYKSCKTNPKDILGKKYFSSSADKEFKTDQKTNPQNYKYKIVRILKDKREAMVFESLLHKKFKVGKNPKFYNKTTQLHENFDTSGLIRCLTVVGDSVFVESSDERIKSGELTVHQKNKTVVKDKDGNYFQVDVTDPRLLSGELAGCRKNLVTAKDKDGNIVSVEKQDPRYISGELVGVLKNKVIVKDKNGNKFSVDRNDPRYLSGELVGHSTGTFTGRDKYGNTAQITKQDPRYISGELKGPRGKFI